jgi:ankyrin repeat protein
LKSYKIVAQQKNIKIINGLMKKIKFIIVLLLLITVSKSFSQSKSKVVTPTREVTEEFYDAVLANNTQKAIKMLGTTFPAKYEPKGKITPLEAAIWQNNLTLVKALVEGGANINNTVEAAKGDDSTTSAVESAVGKDTIEILKYLLSKGGDISGSAFNTASFDHSYDSAKLLLLKGANQDKGDIRGKLWMYEEAVRKSDYEVLNALKLNKDELNSHNYDGQTPLIIAVKKNNLEMVKYLLKRGVDKNKPETFDAGDDISYGKKPIQIAIKMKFTEMVKLLK